MNETQTVGINLGAALAAFGVSPDRVQASPGNTTSLWRVDSGGSSYVLRRHPIDSASRLRSTHDLLSFLAVAFRRSPQVRTTREGRDLVERPEGIYELLTYLSGDVSVTGWDFDWDDDPFLQSAGALLADLNVALRGYKPPSDAIWYREKPTPKAAEVQALLAHDATTEARAILANLELVYKYLDAFPRDSTPRHVIHNDFAWYNVVRHGHSAVGVFDFDSAHLNSELYDVAYAVYAFAPIQDSIKAQARPFKRTARRVALFVNGYEERLGSPLRLQPEILLDAASYRVALSATNLIAGLLQGEERSKRLLSHVVGYSEWLGWYETSRSQLVNAMAEVP